MTTQNVDGLYRGAGGEGVVELHGSLDCGEATHRGRILATGACDARGRVFRSDEDPGGAWALLGFYG
ncbi:Sir2 family NAD-dependent protein deacetylase [Streptomyces noursei]|uniref:Sir2 family NAD-dependent protein deacetylase n=1 Tax=Streptomyces noursei TaxID=1971 RepID=UPI00381EA0E1